MVMLKFWSLIFYSFGLVIMCEGYSIKDWFIENAWLGLPMMCIGAVGICLLWGKEN